MTLEGINPICGLFPLIIRLRMNGLNCESKKTSRKTLRACIITATVSVFMTLLTVAIVFFSMPGAVNLWLADFYIDRYHLGDDDEAKIADRLIEGYVGGLDDNYAHFYGTEATEIRSDKLKGAALGLGMVAVKHPETEAALVHRVYKDSPCDKAGIKKGDVVTKIGKYILAETGYSKTFELLSFSENESVEVTVLRDGKPEILTLTAGNITVQTVFYEKQGDYGYIEITSFNAATVPQFEEAISALTSLGVSGLVFDVRDNGGGTVDSVGEILDILLPEGVTMTTTDKKGTKKVELTSDAEFIDLPMAVLVNEKTASASELFAANIRDFEKGVLIGEKTFGKGVMQSTYDLFFGKSIVLTTAEFVAHGGIPHNGVGIVPDIELKLTDEEKLIRYYDSVANDPAFIAATDYLKGE